MSDPVIASHVKDFEKIVEKFTDDFEDIRDHKLTVQDREGLGILKKLPEIPSSLVVEMSALKELIASLYATLTDESNKLVAIEQRIHTVKQDIGKVELATLVETLKNDLQRIDAGARLAAETKARHAKQIVKATQLLKERDAIRAKNIAALKASKESWQFKQRWERVKQAARRLEEAQKISSTHANWTHLYDDAETLYQEVVQKYNRELEMWERAEEDAGLRLLVGVWGQDLDKTVLEFPSKARMANGLLSTLRKIRSGASAFEGDEGRTVKSRPRVRIFEVEPAIVPMFESLDGGLNPNLPNQYAVVEWIAQCQLYVLNKFRQWAIPAPDRYAASNTCEQSTLSNTQLVGYHYFTPFNQYGNDAACSGLLYKGPGVGKTAEASTELSIHTRAGKDSIVASKAGIKDAIGQARIFNVADFNIQDWLNGRNIEDASIEEKAAELRKKHPKLPLKTAIRLMKEHFHDPKTSPGTFPEVDPALFSEVASRQQSVILDDDEEEAEDEEKKASKPKRSKMLPHVGQHVAAYVLDEVLTRMGVRQYNASGAKGNKSPKNYDAITFDMFRNIFEKLKVFTDWAYGTSEKTQTEWQKKRQAKGDPLMGMVIFIDEAHLLTVLGEGQDKFDLQKFVEMVHYSRENSGPDAVQLFLLSATPVYKHPLNGIRILMPLNHPRACRPFMQYLQANETEEIRAQLEKDFMEREWVAETGRFRDELTILDMLKGKVAAVDITADNTRFATIFSNLPNGELRPLVEQMDFKASPYAMNLFAAAIANFQPLRLKKIRADLILPFFRDLLEYDPVNGGRLVFKGTWPAGKGDVRPSQIEMTNELMKAATWPGIANKATGSTSQLGKIQLTPGVYVDGLPPDFLNWSKAEVTEFFESGRMKAMNPALDALVRNVRTCHIRGAREYEAIYLSKQRALEAEQGGPLSDIQKVEFDKTRLRYAKQSIFVDLPAIAGKGNVDAPMFIAKALEAVDFFRVNDGSKLLQNPGAAKISTRVDVASEDENIEDEEESPSGRRGKGKKKAPKKTNKKNNRQESPPPSYAESSAALAADAPGQCKGVLVLGKDFDDTAKKLMVPMFNAKENADGCAFASVVIYSSAHREGMDLADIRFAHRYGPVSSAGAQRQGLARPVRHCLNINRPFLPMSGGALTHVFTYDVYIENSDGRRLHVQEIAPLLFGTSDQVEVAIARLEALYSAAAFDRLLNRPINEASRVAQGVIGLWPGQRPLIPEDIWIDYGSDDVL